MRTILLTVFVLATMVWGPSSAATKELSSAVLKAIPWDENAPDLDTRRRFAQAIEAYWKDFDARVPRLSPQEREWLEKEMRSSEKRSFRASKSPELAIWMLNQRTETCLGEIRNVLNAMANEASRQFEMYHWLTLMDCYEDPGDVVHYLDKAGIRHILDQEGFSHDQAESAFRGKFGFILDTIVKKTATAAMFETMGWSLVK